MNLQYFCGLFDGEGCIVIVKHKPMRKESVSYTLAMQVVMTNERVVSMVQQEFGGNYNAMNWHTRHNNRTAYLWRLHSRNAADLLVRMDEFLIVKKAEARVAVEFQNHMDEMRNKLRHRSPEEKAAVYEYREQIYRTLQAMKRVSGALDGMDANSGNTQNGQSRAKLRSI